MTTDPRKPGRGFALLLALCLVATLAFVVLGCFYDNVLFPWLALAFGTLTLVIGVMRYLKS